MRTLLSQAPVAAACLTTALAILLPTGCSSNAQPELEYSAELAQDLNYTGFYYYDPASTCNVGGLNMHCCQQNFVMIGAHIGNNVWKCAEVSGGTRTPFSSLSGSDTRNGMHSCPKGSFLMGMHVGKDIWACTNKLQPETVSEITDGNPPTLAKDSMYPVWMHVCPVLSNGQGGTRRYAMTGAHIGNNIWNCGTTDP